MKRMIARKTTDNTMPDFDSRPKGDKLLVFAKFVSFDESFYELNRLIGISLAVTRALPVTSVEAERSFSSLKLIKTHLRTTMLDDRLSDRHCHVVCAFIIIIIIIDKTDAGLNGLCIRDITF